MTGPIRWSPVPSLAFEVLVALYNSTDGGNWTNNTDWLTPIETTGFGSAPCGWFGVRCAAGSVWRLQLPGNNLTGSIPAELGGLTVLTILSLSGNNLTGSIPAELGNLTALTELRLGINQLSGAIPVELGNLRNLEVLRLVRNQLDGLVPLPVALLGGAIQQTPSGDCSFESNPGLFMPDSQDYMDADLNNDGVICGIPLGTPPS